MPPKPKPPPSTSAPPNHPPPNWPKIHPVTPAADLSLHPLLHDHILTIPHLWTTALCKTYVRFLATLPLTTTPGTPRKGDAVRVNDRFQVDDPAFADRLWRETGLGELVRHPVLDEELLDEAATKALWGGDVLGLNSNIRIYRYRKGQFFDQHYDDSNHVLFPSATSPNPTPAKTTWTLLLYLTSPATGCRGGETVFYPAAPRRRDAAPPPVIANLDVGMALLHRHGHDCLLHEGREVTAGEKWVIRSDLVVKR
ncbi:2OG-Fe(II) oxygenase superfamily [Teratosphaeria destructans]|uniref:2OG-Fe(II) oxygenase superfamily n=1 Tax=Teratosphaeria destructans TaxID=418781 RepID=A0A9W7SWR1_9PEZI|nr:2OG-Fe(II) oxygenase superfamily [Teratosphaeria destructans]